MSSLKDDASLILIPSLYKDGRLDTVKPLGNSIVHPDATGNHDGTDGSTLPEANFTFSRGSNLAATRVDVNGLIEKGRENLFTYSNTFSDSSWLKADTSVTGGQAGYDGTNDAWLLEITGSTGFQTIRKQPISYSGVNTFSFYAKAGTLSWVRVNTGVANTYFDIGNGVVGATDSSIGASIEAAGNGYYRCIVPVSGSSTTFYIYPASGNGNVSQSSGNIYIQNAQWEQGLIATDYIETGASTAQAGILEDMPRLDYSGGASCPSLLLEPQRANIIDQSEYFGAWTFSSAITLTHNYATSPEGIQNATLLARTTSGNVQQSKNITSGSTYAISVFAKTGTSSIVKIISTGLFEVSDTTFDLSDQSITTTLGSVVDADIEDYGNGWYRCWVTQTAASTGTGQVRINTGDNVNILLYGAQLEQGSYPTSYIPTYGSSVTRSGDGIANIDLRTNSHLSGTNFTYMVDLTSNTSVASFSGFFNETDSSGGYKAGFVWNNGLQWRTPVSGSNQYITIDSSVADGDRAKMLVRCTGSLREIFYNGSKLSTSKVSDNAGSDTDGFTCYYASSNANFFSPSYNQILVFDTALTDSECIALTE